MSNLATVLSHETHGTQTAVSLKAPSQNNSNDRTARMTIIGGGVTGSGVFCHTIRAYEARLTADPAHLPAPIEITFFDAGGDFGQGVVYSEQPYRGKSQDLFTTPGTNHWDTNFVFKLNRTASEMSPFPEDPQHFVRWLENFAATKNPYQKEKAKAEYERLKKNGLSDEAISYRHPRTFIMATDYSANDYIPRNLFGLYMRDNVRHAVADAQRINRSFGMDLIRIRLDPHAVVNAGENPDGTIFVKASDSNKYDSDGIIVATGHFDGGLYKDLRGKPHYANTPLSMKEVKANLPPAGMNVLVIGTGPSMVDALAGLEAIGYKGEIIAISREGILPWPDDAGKDSNGRTYKTLQHITPEAVRALAQNKSLSPRQKYETLRDLLFREIHCDQALDIGSYKAHQRVAAEMPAFKAMMAEYPKEWTRFETLFTAVDKNGTPPDRYKMIKRIQDEGRLSIKRYGIDPKKDSLPVELPKGGFRVKLRAEDGSVEEMDVGAIYDCTSLVRRAMDADHFMCPVIESLAKCGLAFYDAAEGRVQASKGNEHRVIIAGPAGQEPFGVVPMKHRFALHAGSMVKLCASVSSARPAIAAAPMLG